MKWTLYGKALATACAIIMTGCASQPPKDYSAFKESRPRSILVLPPLNNTPDLQASNSVLSYVTRPLAEAGYYVVPVTLVAETFQQNGMTQAADMHSTPAEKLRSIFGADAALYITVTEYGTVFLLVNSVSRVTAKATLVDLKTGKQLWTGTATASSDEGQNQSSGGLLGAVLTAVVKQAIASSVDESHKVAARTTTRLLSPGAGTGGVLFGPRSPHYGKD